MIRRDPADEISLGLVGDHHLGEVSALGDELDNVAGDDLTDEIRRDLGALGFELA